MIFNFKSNVAALLLLGALGTTANSNPRDWMHVGGGATEIGAGHWATVIGYSNTLYYINKSDTARARNECMDGFTLQGGNGKAMDGGGIGHVWIIGMDNFIYSGNKAGWYGTGDNSYSIPAFSPSYPQGIDLGSNFDNDLCILTNAPNNNIWCRPRGETGFTNIDGYIKRVAVLTGSSNPIGITADGTPVQRNGSYQTANGVRSHVGNWIILDSVNKYKDISVGPNGVIWGIRTDNTIWKDIANTPVQILGGATKVAVDNENVAWVIGTTGITYKYIGHLPANPNKTSRQYKFQRCGAGINALCFRWDDTNYKWCAENENYSDLGYGEIGELEFWDNDRIVSEGHSENVPCDERCEITSKQCTHDSNFGTAKLFRC